MAGRARRRLPASSTTGWEKLDPAAVDRWFARAGWEKVLNRNGTTFHRTLPEARKAGIDGARAREMILARPIIKRGARHGRRGASRLQGRRLQQALAGRWGCLN